MAADHLHDAAEAGLGLRCGAERRKTERRREPRPGPDRRKQARRMATLRSLLLSVIAFVAPHAGAKPSSGPKLNRVLSSRPGPRVTVSIDSFEPVDRSHAYDEIIHEAAETYDLDPVLIRSVIRMESGFDPMAVSRVGARGLMQLMPDVSAELGVKDPFDPRQNIMGGSQLLRTLLDRHNGNLALTLASYNAGPRAVAKHGNRVPPFRETRRYVKQITDWLLSSD